MTIEAFFLLNNSGVIEGSEDTICALNIYIYTVYIFLNAHLRSLPAHEQRRALTQQKTSGQRRGDGRLHGSVHRVFMCGSMGAGLWGRVYGGGSMGAGRGGFCPMGFPELHE